MPMSRSRFQDWLMLLALTAMWGSAFALTKIAVTHLPPAAVVAGRLFIGAVILLGLFALLSRRLPRGRRAWLFLFLIAAIGNTAPFLLISWGQRYIDSGLAGLLMACMPLFTLTLAHFCLPDERMTPTRAAGFVLGFCGVVVLIGPESLKIPDAHAGQPVAMLAVLVGAACYAVAAILTRLRPPGDALSAAAATTVIAAMLSIPLLTATGAAPSSMAGADSLAWLAIFLLGGFSTAAAAIVYFRLVSSAGPAFVSQLNYLIPVWAVGVGIMFLGEQPEMNHLYAMLLILAGVLIAQRGRGLGAATRSIGAVAALKEARVIRRAAGSPPSWPGPERRNES